MKTYSAERTPAGLEVQVEILDRGGLPPESAVITKGEPPWTTWEVAGDHRQAYALPVPMLGRGTEFECGYPGHGPALLALAILFDHYDGDLAKTEAAAGEFERHYIQEIPQFLTKWAFTTVELQAMLDAIEERLGFEQKDLEEMDKP